MHKSSFVFAGTAVLAFWIAFPAVRAAAAEPVDYESQIEPILAEHCFQCHGSRERKSGLRLDSPGRLLEGGNRGKAVAPKKAEASLLYKAVTGKADFPRMPLKKEKLADEQIALLRQWIEQGAGTPEGGQVDAARRQSDHWSFQPIRRPKVPQVANADWVRNPIDAFVLRRLQEEGLEPSPAAERTTLIRRLSLDLRGLPPSVDEVERFLNDTRPGAYERLVDRMLASPHYGERWARHWLDVARYADSNGYTIDSSRSIWKYRDWVIDAFNRDLPFDRFTIQQLAGDMLPDTSRKQLIATGFHRNTLINEEGGTDDEQFRVEAVVDRVSTTGEVWLGLTLGCARCHEHKFDPISQREFYELFAVFNNCSEPNIRVPNPEQKRELDKLNERVADARRQLRRREKELDPSRKEWEARPADKAGASWTVLDPVSFRSQNGATMKKLDDGSLLVDGDAPASDVYRVTVEVPFEAVTAVRIEALTHESLPGGGPGLTSHGNFTLNEFELYAASSRKAEEPQRIELKQAIADYSQKHGDVAFAIDGDPETFWGVYAPSDEIHQDREAIFVPAEPVRLEGGTRLRLVLRQHYRNPKYLIGRLRVSATETPRERITLPDDVQKILAVAPEKRTKKQRELLQRAFYKSDARWRKLSAELAELEKRKKKLTRAVPTTMVLRERGKPRTTHVHLRGDFLQKGAVVQPDVPDVLPSLPDEIGRPTRLDFARWLVSPENPLTARVTVNRFWQRFFGRGLVRTENDFGTQGTPPTHPELLDWLAREFIRRGWSMKSLHRLIVTSATYRQSSHVRDELLERDPNNRLLARQSRFRLQAETIRDVSLAASGLLTREIGGPSVYPPQPKGIYVLTQKKKKWPEENGPDRYRRGMYTFFWRSSPYPFLTTFDAPDANTTCTRRERSNTPLQALTLANDRAFVEMAKGLSRRILTQGPDDAEGRIRFAFRCCLSREPNKRELNRLLDFVEKQRRYFALRKGASLSASPPELPDGVSAAEGATWTTLARVLLNLDEFITRE